MGVNLTAPQAQVAASVQPLMVLQSHNGGSAHGAVGLGKGLGADGGVGLDNCPLVRRQRPGLIQDRGRNRCLADVMDKRELGNRPDLVFWAIS